MNLFQPYTKSHLTAGLGFIQQAIYSPIGLLKITIWRTHEPVPFSQRESGEELQVKIGDRWGELFDCAWFHFTGQIPETAAGLPVVLLLDVNGEMCVFNNQGIPIRGLTSRSSEFDKSLGLPGKRVLPFSDRVSGGELVDVWADAGCNDLFGYVQDNGVIREAHIAVVYPEIRALYYDFEVLLDSLKVLPEESARSEQIRVALFNVIHLIWNGITSENAQAAREILAPLLQSKGGDPCLQISAIGHAHIDLGWLWPIRETHRKGARTFSTAIANIEMYPDYKFSASQAQLFQWIKEDHPELFSKIRKLVSEGRIEPQGALWVECDTNLTSGESLIRQILYGKKFFNEEFGVNPDYVWLPDTFGYSAALPQIIRRSGLSYFSTQKLSWSLINKFPHHSFHWQGIDGTSVLVHMLPEETYNSSALPRAISKIEKNYAQKGVSQHALMVYGIGDGGGGPGEEHLERLKRLKNFNGLSPVESQWTKDFFIRWEKDADQFPTWEGELYLERHQGTLTTNGRNKWYNRRMEQDLRELEWVASINAQVSGYPYPKERLESIWKEVLLYQFHDILPGSSIKRVYDESLTRYAILQSEVQTFINENIRHFAELITTEGYSQPWVIFNSLGWQREKWIKLDEQWVKALVPAMGMVVIDANQTNETFPVLKATPESLENDYLRIKFNIDGSIKSLFDKKTQRELVPIKESMNRLAVYTDHGDAWDIPMDYAETQPAYMELVSTRAWVDGPRAIMEQIYRIGSSELVQEISLTAGSNLVAFDNHLHWREKSTMLRVIFPAAIFAEEALYEIQFGYVKRPTHTNTTWDLAKDEVPAQKWVDLAQRDYGLALINDSKYGHRIKGHTIELNLLRSVPYPGQRVFFEDGLQPGDANFAYTDQADHTFRYALLPHTGDFVVGEVVQKAYEFNIPLKVVKTSPHKGILPDHWSSIEVNQPNIVIETIKQSEDGNSIIIRLYEAWRSETNADLNFGFPVHEALETNLLELNDMPLEIKDNKVNLKFKPFEIKTIRIY